LLLKVGVVSPVFQELRSDGLSKLENIYKNGLDEFVIKVDRVTTQRVDTIEASFEYLDPDYQDYFSDVFEIEQLLNGLAKARNGEMASIKGAKSGVLDITSANLAFNKSDRSLGGQMPIDTTFDHFFLDAFTVIENGERKRHKRDISIGEAENCILGVLKKDPALIRQLDARVFEVSVSAVLRDIGFDRVELSRFSKDGGTDILAFYVEGGVNKTVVVEVKRHKDNVGIGVADRLFGVQHRDKRDKSLLVTSSAIAKGVVESYSAHTETMSFMDFAKLSELLQRDSSWSQSPSGLWTQAAPVTENQSLI
jgi:hypothetical protein